MCGRYYIDDETSREIRKILEQLDAKYENNNRKTGEIFPTDTAPILAAFGKNIEPEVSVWGFPNYYKKGVLINSRAETVLDKKTFRESVLSRRCIIPSSGFYEWDSSKNKFYFKRDNTEILYMAGVYNFFNEECRFVILTTQSNQSMNGIHDRMPVVLDQEEVEQWILDNNSISRLLNQVPPALNRISRV